MGGGGKTRAEGASWGWQGGMGGLLGCRWGSLGWQGRSFGGMTCFGKHIFLSLRNVVIWAADGPCTSLMA